MTKDATNPIEVLSDMPNKMASGSDIEGVEDVTLIKNIFSTKSMSGTEKISSDSEFTEKSLDRKSNRTLREKIAYKISVMMFCELLFIFVLLTGIFIVPYINAFTPTITLHLPPLVLTISSITALVFIFGILNGWQSKKAIFAKIILILLLWYTINYSSRISWSFTIKEIVLSKDIIKLILTITETIFIKTTILAGFIIHGLFNDLKKQ